MKRGSTESRFARIRRVYVGTALIFFNTALLLAVLLVTIHFGLNAFEWFRGPNRVYSTQFDLSAFTEADEETALAIVREFDAHAAGRLDRQGLGEYDYQPWVGFAERPFSGSYLNVEERRGYTVQRTSAPEPIREGVEDFVVWAFGGSTQFGFGINDARRPRATFSANSKLCCLLTEWLSSITGMAIGTARKR